MKLHFAIIAACLVIPIILVGCGNRNGKIDFPLSDIVPPSLDRPLEGGTEFEMNLYLQSTSYMSGFVFDESAENALEGDAVADDNYMSNFIKVIPVIVDSAKSCDNTPTYYRFDCLSLKEVNGSFPYLIDDRKFGVDSIKANSSDFYSIPWYFNEPKGSLYEQLYGNDKQNYEDYYKENYLAETFSALKKDEVSVIITDFVDYDFQTSYENSINPESQTVTKVISELVDLKGKSVSVFTVESDFNGSLYTGGRLPADESTYSGKRPFYIVVYGDTEQSLVYCETLTQALQELSKNTGVNNESNVTYTFFTTGVKPSSNIVYNKDVDKSNIETKGMQSVFMNQISVSEDKNISNAKYEGETPLYYKLENSSDIGWSLSINMPLSLPFGVEVNENPVISLRKVGNIAGDSNKVEYGYKDVPVVGVNGIIEFVDDSNATLNLTFDRDDLIKAGEMLDGIYKYQIVVDVQSNQQNYDASNIIQSNSIGLASAKSNIDFGRKTVGLTDIMSPVMKKMHDVRGQSIAYFVIYISTSK